MADALFQQGISFTLLQRIRNASTPRDANEILLEYLYEADSDKPWQDFLQVLGSPDLWWGHPMMKRYTAPLCRLAPTTANSADTGSCSPSGAGQLGR